MSLNESALRAVSAIQNDRVRITAATPQYYFFEVNDQEVIYDVRKDYWFCGCVHESWRKNPNKLCYHIKAAMRFKDGDRKDAMPSMP